MNQKIVINGTAVFTVSLAGVIFKPTKKINKQSKLIGKNIVFTGFRSIFLKTIIEYNYGANVQQNIQKNTDILICLNSNLKTTKITKAKKDGISVLKLSSFIKKYLYNYYNFDNDNPKNDYTDKIVNIKKFPKKIGDLTNNKIVKRYITDFFDIYLNNVTIKSIKKFTKNKLIVNWCHTEEIGDINKLKKNVEYNFKIFGNKNKVNESSDVYNVDSLMPVERLFYFRGPAVYTEYIKDTYVSYHPRLAWNNIKLIKS